MGRSRVRWVLLALADEEDAHCEKPLGEGAPLSVQESDSMSETYDPQLEARLTPAGNGRRLRIVRVDESSDRLRP